MSNPLRQYFRRPALHFTLPSKGRFYPDGAIDMPETGELPVFPMTAIDEITSKTPDALFNGSAIVDIIKSCVPSIKDPWSIPSTDLDAILIVIRSATTGNDFEINSSCPSCETEGAYNLNLMNLLLNIKVEGYNDPLNLGELAIKFKPLSYRDVNKGNLVQFNMQRDIAQLEKIEDETERSIKSSETMKRLSKLNVDFLSSTIESVQTPTDIVTSNEFIVEFLENCDRNTHDLLRKKVVELRDSTSIKPQKIKCVNCSHEYEQSISLNVTDFFG
jgi:hypothetical protein